MEDKKSLVEQIALDLPVEAITDAELHEMDEYEIADRILLIKRKVQSTALAGAIEIGRCLIEAKSKVPEGEWLDYVEEECEFSISTAENWMRLASDPEYVGTVQTDLFNDTPNPEIYALISPSAALELQKLDAKERRDLMEQGADGQKIEEMSVRDLRKLISDRKKERDAANEEIQEMKDRLKKATWDEGTNTFGQKLIPFYREKREHNNNTFDERYYKILAEMSAEMQQGYADLCNKLSLYWADESKINAYIADVEAGNDPKDRYVKKNKSAPTVKKCYYSSTQQAPCTYADCRKAAIENYDESDPASTNCTNGDNGCCRYCSKNLYCPHACAVAKEHLIEETKKRKETPSVLIAEAIRVHRIDKGLTLKRLADMTKITLGELERAESPNYGVPLETDVKIFKALGMSFDAVLLHKSLDADRETKETNNGWHMAYELPRAGTKIAVTLAATMDNNGAMRVLKVGKDGTLYFVDGKTEYTAYFRYWRYMPEIPDVWDQPDDDPDDIIIDSVDDLEKNDEL